MDFESTILEPAAARGISDTYSVELDLDITANTMTVVVGCPVKLKRFDADIVNSDCQ